MKHSKSDCVIVLVACDFTVFTRGPQSSDITFVASSSPHLSPLGGAAVVVVVAVGGRGALVAAGVGVGGRGGGVGSRSTSWSLSSSHDRCVLSTGHWTEAVALLTPAKVDHNVNIAMTECCVSVKQNEAYNHCIC